VSVLADIISGVREDLSERQAALPLAAVREHAAAAPPALPVLPAPDFGLICEVKRASPSAGALAVIPDPAAQAADYTDGGAHAISVLTEQRRFAGSLADLDAVRAAVDVPVLRKDFMVDEYQFYEARAHGADIVLLIVAALDDAQLRDYRQLAAELGMSVLVEAHTADEVERAAVIGADLFGINTRNLKDLSVDPARFTTLAAHCPPGAVLVAESGVGGTADIDAYARAGASLALVGEALVRSPDPSEAVRAFTAAGRSARKQTSAPAERGALNGHNEGSNDESRHRGDRTVLR